MSSKKNIIIRMDSSSTIGLGHLMRTLILANGLKEHFNLIFFAQPLRGNQNFLVTQNGFLLHTLSEATKFYQEAKVFKPCLIIIDNYDITSKQEEELKKICDVLVFDDEYRQHSADIVLNHSFVSSQKAYSYLKNTTTVLTGAKYTLLRDEFFIPTVFVPLKSYKNKKILITLGGSDPKNLSVKIKKYLLHIYPSLHVTILSTSANKKIKYLQTIDKELIINEKNMAYLMSGYDLIITSASTSLLETIALSKPFIAIKCASNQTKTVDILLKQNLNNVIKYFSHGALKRALAFVQNNPAKIKHVCQKYRFYKNGAAKWIINEYK